jgi:hypothetical protein
MGERCGSPTAPCVGYSSQGAWRTTWTSRRCSRGSGPRRSWTCTPQRMRTEPSWTRTANSRGGNDP